jgi:hypothetical protein
MNNQIATWAIESFVETLNNHGVYSYVLSDEIIGETQYIEILIKPIRPLEMIYLDYTIVDGEFKCFTHQN